MVTKQMLHTDHLNNQFLCRLAYSQNQQRLVGPSLLEICLQTKEQKLKEHGQIQVWGQAVDLVKSRMIRA